MGCEAEDSRMIIMHPLYLPSSSPWLDVKVFYMRVGNYEINRSTPEHLTVNHIPLTPDTILEINGRRSGMYSDCLSSELRRDRADKRSEEATFVSTDSIRMTGSVRFEVCDGGSMFFGGILELSYGNGLNCEAKSHDRKWIMRCGPIESSDCSFLNRKHATSDGLLPPVIEVYVAGSFMGTPIILTKAIHFGRQKKHHMNVMLDSIPEYDATCLKKELLPKNALQVAGDEDNALENDLDVECYSVHSGGNCVEEDGELSWFNAGVKVGVGISLGICLGIGIGVGLLVRTYRATTRNFKK